MNRSNIQMNRSDIQWIGFSEDSSPQEEIQPIVVKLGYVLKWHTQLNAFRESLAKSAGAVVFLKTGASYDVYELTKEITVQYPLTSVILLVPAGELHLKKAMHSGAIDMLELPLSHAELSEAIQQSIQNLEAKIGFIPLSDKQGKLPDGRIITVCGTKGGVGKSTLSTNLAVAFSKYDYQVAMLDLDLQFGDVADLLDLTPPKLSLYDWVKEEYDNPMRNIDKFLLQHSTGVKILAAPPRPEFADMIAGEHVKAALADLKQRFDVIVVDTPASWVETGLTALELSSDILLVTSMELPTLKNSKLGIETLDSLGLKERMKLVLNRDSEAEGIQIQTAEKILGHDIYARIPSEGKVVVPSVNTGIPFVDSKPRASVSRSVFALVKKLQADVSEPIPSSQKPRKSLFSKWFKS